MKNFAILCLLIVLSAKSFSQSLTKVSYKKKSKKSYVEYSPDGQYYVAAQGKVLTFYPAGSDYNKWKLNEYLNINLKNDFTIKEFGFNKTGTRVAMLHSGTFFNQISVWDVIEKRQLSNCTIKKEYIRTLKLMNDSLLTYITDNYKVVVYNYITQRVSWEKTFESNTLRGLAFGEGNNVIAVGGKDQLIYLISINENHSIITLSGPTNWVRCLDFTSDGTKLVCGSDDANVYVYDVKTKGSEPFIYTVHKDWVTTVKFTSDNKYIASTSKDRSCVFYDLNKKATTFQLKKVSKSIDGLSIDPNGKDFFINSHQYMKNHLRDISNLNIIPYQKLKDKTDKLAPQIYISNPARIEEGKTVVYASLLKLEGSVIDESGVRELKINDRVVKMKENGQYVMYVPLSIGDNYLKFEAIDINDNVAIKKINIIRKDTEGQDIDTLTSKSYLLVIGINNYQAWPQLNNAVRDAKEIYKTLTEQYDFDTAYAYLMIDSMATKENIEKKIRSLIPLISQQDNLLIYYAGHGYFDPVLNEGYWIPVEAVNESQYISNTTLLKYLSNINSKHTFLVVDACFSGSLFASRNRGYADNVEKYKSRWGLASGRLETVADGAYGANSPFATSFIEFLENNSKDEVPVSDVVQYVKVNVSNVTKQTPIGSPLRDIGDEGGEYVFKKKKK